MTWVGRQRVFCPGALRIMWHEISEGRSKHKSRFLGAGISPGNVEIVPIFHGFGEHETLEKQRAWWVYLFTILLKNGDIEILAKPTFVAQSPEVLDSKRHISDASNPGQIYRRHIGSSTLHCITIFLHWLKQQNDTWESVTLGTLEFFHHRAYFNFK